MRYFLVYHQIIIMSSNSSSSISSSVFNAILCSPQMTVCYCWRLRNYVFSVLQHLPQYRHRIRHVMYWAASVLFVVLTYAILILMFSKKFLNTLHSKQF